MMSNTSDSPLSTSSHSNEKGNDTGSTQYSQGYDSQARLEQAVAALQAGDIVAFPTETVYGLGADARNPAAVAKIFAAKGRPADHPLIVHLADIAQLEHWAQAIPETAYQLAEAFWPGPLTLILRKQPSVADIVTGGQSTVGLRIPQHPVALALLQAFGDGIAAPSANRFGRISPTTASHVHAEFSDDPPLILDGGACTYGLESSIIDLSSSQARLLRPGSLSLSSLQECLGTVLEQPSKPAKALVASSDPVPRVSGSLSSHYAPSTPAYRSDFTSIYRYVQAQTAQERARVGLLLRRPWPSHYPPVALAIQLADNPSGYGYKLYSSLRRLDSMGLQSILVEQAPEEATWLAVADRLQRATEPLP